MKRFPNLKTASPGTCHNNIRICVQAIGSSQNLTVVVSKRTEGEYYCHGISEGFDLGEKGGLGMCVSVVTGEGRW